MKCKLMQIVVFLLALSTVTVFARSPDSVVFKYKGSTLWSGMRDVVVRDTLVYAAMTSGLMIFDVSDPTAPESLSTLYFPEGWATDIKLAGDYVYLTEWGGSKWGRAWEGALHIIDVSNPRAPSLMGSYYTPTSAGGVDVEGGIACVVYGLQYSAVPDAPQGLLVLDVSNPASIIPLANLPMDVYNNPKKVKMWGDYAYVVGGGSVIVVDLADPGNPDSLTQYSTGFYSIDLTGIVGDTLLYLADRDPFWPAGVSAFSILNIADPVAPVLVGGDTLAGLVSGVAVSESLAFVANGSCGLQVYDVTDPSAPLSLGSCLVEGMAWKVAVSDTVAYVVDFGLPTADDEVSPCRVTPYVYEGRPYPGDFQVISVSDPSNPEVVGYYPFPGYVTDVAACGNYLYALNRLHKDSIHVGADVTVVDVSDQERPHVVGTYTTAGTGERAVVVDDTLLYLAAGGGGLEIINVADPSHPFLVGSHAVEAGALDVIVRDNYAYVADASAGVKIFDISDRVSPRLATSITTTPYAKRLALQGNYLYIGAINLNVPTGRLYVVNVANPESPILVYTSPVGYYVDIAVLGEYLYAILSDGINQALYIYSISNPEEPVFLSSYFLGQEAYDLDVQVNYVFIAKGLEGIEVVDVSEPTIPHWVGEYNTPGAVAALMLAGNSLYVADGWELLLLQYNLPTSVNEPSSNLFPTDFVLHQNYPNPFNPSTTIRYELPSRAHVKLTVYDILGREVVTLVDEVMPAGMHSVRWDGKDAHGDIVSSGIYFYRLKAGGTFEAKKMMLLK